MRLTIYIIASLVVYLGGRFALDWWHDGNYPLDGPTYWFAFFYGWICHTLWSNIKAID